MKQRWVWLFVKKFTPFMVLVLAVVVSFSGCSLYAGNNSNNAKTAEASKINRPDGEEAYRVVSQSPDGNIRLVLGKDNNLYISDTKGERIIYRNYEKDSGLLNHPYSLWSFDHFRIQWSDNGRYAFIIDSIYDAADDKLIPIKDCLIFSWNGNRGIYLSEGKLLEGKFWDHGFYGLYASKCIKIFEDGKIKKIEKRADDRYFVVTESSWDETEKTLYRCIGPAVEVMTAKFRFNNDEMYDKLIKAYQELREDEEVWGLLSGEYVEADSRRKALENFKRLKSMYPIKLVDEDFVGNRLNWDFDMNYYLVDIETEKIS